MAAVLHDVSDILERASRGPQLMLIDGKWEQAEAREHFDVFDPVTGKVIAKVPSGQRADIDRAVKAAARAFESRVWLNLGAQERAKILWRVAELIDKNASDLTNLESLNNGMPVELAGYTISMGAEAFRYYAGWCTKINGQTSDISAGPSNVHAFTLKEPVGVAGMITPWNSPLSLACTKVAAALAAGCTCVIKPAEETPLSTLRLAEIALEAGVPPGVVNVVTGFGHAAGAARAGHPGVAKIAFTGS